MQQESAETLALAALTWLAGQEDLFGVFLGASGADVAAVRNRAQDPEFLAAVLDFLLMDDAWVTGFAAAEGVDPARVQQARAVLPGGAQMHWT